MCVWAVYIRVRMRTRACPHRNTGASACVYVCVWTLLWQGEKALWRSMEMQGEQSPVVQLSPILRVCSVSSEVWTLQACRNSPMSPTSRTTVPLGSFRSSAGFPSQQPDSPGGRETSSVRPHSLAELLHAAEGFVSMAVCVCVMECVRMCVRVRERVGLCVYKPVCVHQGW